MNTHNSGLPRIPNWRLVSLSALVLLLCLFYTYAHVFWVPEPGITFNTKWIVTSIDPCDTYPGWCEANQGGFQALQVGDQLIAIGHLTYQDYWDDKRRVLFDGYGPGESVPITLSRDGDRQAINWRMPVFISTNRARRLTGLLFYLPFWLAGTVVLLLLQPRDRRWRLLVSFNYLTAFWLAVGMVSSWQVAASSLVLHAVTWLMAPVYLHLHLIVPTPLLRGRSRYFLPLLYTIAAILAVLELFQLLPTSAYALGLLLAIPGSLGLLLSRLFDRSSPSARLAVRLMLAGVGLAFGPGIALWLIPKLLNAPGPGGLTVTVAILAVPVLPLFYTYAIYKRHLGLLEFRANRLLSLYSFLLLYVSAFALVFSVGSQRLSLPDSSVVFGLAVSIVFVIAALPLRSRFQHLVDRLSYGTEHDPDDILRIFANRIPAALDRKALVPLLADEVAPSLLIRQSALVLLANGDTNLVYARGVSLSETPETPQQVRQLLAEAGRYRPPLAEAQDEYPDRHKLDWVRLAVPLEIRKKTMGVWLFGRRDPDDYYPQHDIALLTALASQVAVAVENGRLYQEVQRELAERKRAEEALRKAHDELEMRVQERTVDLSKTNEALQAEITERQRTEEEIKQRNRELAALNAIANAANRSLRLEEMLDVSTEKIMDITGADAGCVLLVEGSSRRLRVWGAQGLSPQLVERFEAIAPGEDYWQKGAPLDVSNLWWISDSVKGIARNAGLLPCILLPLRWEKTALGIMLLAGCGSNTLVQWSMEFLMTGSDQLGMAVKNAQLYEEAQRELSERKRAEDALQKAHHELEVRVQERTAELAQANEALQAEIIERKRAEEEIRQHNRELAALNAIAAAMIQSALNLNEVLQRTADGIVEGLGCNTAFIFLLDEEEGIFKGSAVSTGAKIPKRMKAIIGYPLLQVKIPARRDFNKAVNNLLDGRATIKRDFYELARPFWSRTVCSALQKLLDSRAFFTMPLLARGKTVGGIVASTRKELREGDTDKLMPFANQAAIAIQNAQLYQAIQQELTERKQADERIRTYQERLRSLASELSLTEERERREIATALHDRIGQTLAICKIQLGALRQSASSTELAEPLEEIHQYIEDIIQNTRSLTFEISSPILYQLGLESALEWLAEQTQKRDGVRAKFRDDGQPKPLDDDIRIVLFQAVRELLINVVKHAQAQSVEVVIGRDDSHVRIAVEDDGVGFDVFPIGSHWSEIEGFGLFSIRERLSHLGGQLQITSEPGHGTRVALLAPLKREEISDQ